MGAGVPECQGGLRRKRNTRGPSGDISMTEEDREEKLINLFSKICAAPTVFQALF